MEEYLVLWEFVNVDKFVDMWEMWLGCFIKQKHKAQVTKIESKTLAKGVGRIKTGKNHMLGNKGGVS